jgi:hypothetical protein
MTYQVFTIEKSPCGEPVEIFAPNEISLGQLVTHFILPDAQLEASSVFYWNLKETDPSDETDKTKTKRKLMFNLLITSDTLYSPRRSVGSKFSVL